MINVTYDGKTLQQADETQLRKRVIVDEDDNELTTATEYRAYGSDQIIHRSVHVHLKKPMVFAEAAVGSLG